MDHTANKLTLRVLSLFTAFLLCAGMAVIAAPSQALAVSCATNADCNDNDECTNDVCNVSFECDFVPDPTPDADFDGICDKGDNCVATANPGQEDADEDGIGDSCDNCPGDPLNDEDADGYCTGSGFKAPKIGDGDNCPTMANPSQTNGDADAMGDACDLCPAAIGADEDACLGTGAWETRTGNLFERSECGLAADGGSIFLIGGEQTDTGRSVEIYDVAADSWSEGPDMPVTGSNQGRSHTQPVVIDHHIYVIGGLRTTDRKPIDDVIVLNTGNTHDGWMKLQEMPTPRGPAACAAHGRKIYCAGGVVDAPTNPLPPTDAFEMYDTVTDTWTVLTPMPRPRESAFAHVIGDKFYVISGRNLGVNDVVPFTDIYDINTGTWSQGAPPPVARGGYASAVIQGRIILFSGELGSAAGGNENGVVVGIHEYDPARDTWRSLADIPTPRHGFMGILSRAEDGMTPRIYTIAGGPQQGFAKSNLNEVFSYGTCFTNADCDDADACTSDVCNAGVCENDDISASCDDGVSCTNDSCDAGLGCINEVDDSNCDDGVGCTVDVCDAVSDCSNTTDDSFCDDGVGCTVDVCDAVSDCASTADDSLCDDGQFCNGSETCDAVSDCQAGIAPSTDDGVACTVDSCDEATDSIVNSADDSLCDDGQFCNGSETCDAASDCQAGTAPSTDDGVACTVDSCDEATDSIVNSADDSLCDDGQYCNGSETCDAVSDCQAGTAPSTDDGVTCTFDVCDEATDSIVNTADDSLCDDGQYCNGSETCDAINDCQPGDAPSIDDGVDCTVDSCDEDADAIVHTTDDGICNDGLFCNGVETCDDSTGCQAGEAPEVDDSVDCTVDSCDEDTDTIVHATDDGVCNDGLFCNGVETCDDSTGCQAGEAPEVDDSVDCTVDSCDEDADAVVHSIDDGACDDGEFCNGAETCDATAGCIESSSPCDDGVPCTVDGCDENADACTNTPSDEACNDGSFCSGSEFCDATTGCQSNADALDCTALDSECGMGFCDDSIEDCDVVAINEGQSCDDGLLCTGGDICDGGVCVGLPTCDPICERCDAETGSCASLCGVPFTLADEPIVTDVLFILRAASKLEECALCRCDLDGNGMVGATDALAGLRNVVGLTSMTNCPGPEIDGGSTTTTMPASTTSTTLEF